MPDRDIVHSRLAYAFQKPYLQLCEAALDSTEIAHSASRALKTRIGQYGDSPLRYLERVAEQIGDLPVEPLLRSAVDWMQQRRDIERTARQYAGNSKRGSQSAEKAAKQILQQTRRDGPISNLRARLIAQYFANVYECEFEEGVPLTQRHENGVSQAELATRLAAIRPLVHRAVESLAAQAAGGRSVYRLQLPRLRETRRRPSLTDSVLS
jgi:hypothetical protein